MHQVAVQLFLGQPNRLSDRVAYLKQLNEQRRVLTQEYSFQAQSLVEKNKAVQIIVLEDCPIGVLGLVASRLVEALAQPIMVLAAHPNGALHASARAPKGLNLAAALESVADLLVAFGGHAGAAGFQLEPAQLTNFITHMQAWFEAQPAPNLSLAIEGTVKSEWLDNDWCTWENSLEPFGTGNPKPIWQVSGLTLQQIKGLGKTGQHARFSFKEGAEIVAFFCDDLIPLLSPRTQYDVAVCLNENTWNGTTRVQWQLKDIRPV